MELYRENELVLTNEDEEQELIFGENNPDAEQFDEAIKNRVPKDLRVFNKVENEDYTESNQRSAVQFYVFANGIPMVITLEQIKRIIGSAGSGGTLGGIKFRVEGESLEVSYDDGETWTAIGIVKGEDGKTPYIQDGYWYIDGVNTNVKAEGIDGKDGKTAYEYAKEGGYTGTEAEFAQKIAKEIPSKVSQLENDSKFLTSIPSEYVTETELNNKGYLTEHQSLAGYAKTADHYTKTESDSKYQAKGNYLTSFTESDPTVPSWAKASTKPSYTKSEVGLGNVDNTKQYSASNPPPYPVKSVNGQTGAVTGLVETKDYITLVGIDADGVSHSYTIYGKVDDNAPQ